MVKSPIPRALVSVLAGCLLLSFQAASNPAAAAPDDAPDYASVTARQAAHVSRPTSAATRIFAPNGGMSPAG